MRINKVAAFFIMFPAFALLTLLAVTLYTDKVVLATKPKDFNLVKIHITGDGREIPWVRRIPIHGE